MHRVCRIRFEFAAWHLSFIYAYSSFSLAISSFIKLWSPSLLERCSLEQCTRAFQHHFLFLHNCSTSIQTETKFCFFQIRTKKKFLRHQAMLSRSLAVYSIKKWKWVRANWNEITENYLYIKNEIKTKK